ncbi:T9SS type A sorting domain-containing protein [Massilibacteroides vaginae]|uniref:T9SS type A sorting domain-containing protein n=1 Tax=Massilibacteroides vaginae TaxID=1673718 RepID=UPI000A1C8A5D|nr:T9SS type A sorting domain-containing protein [Massilibacteroides vaginae]
MEKNITAMACIAMLIGLCPSLQSQTLFPDQWESFVSTNNTVLVSDTFRMQRFENSITENWTYTLKGNYAIIDASTVGLSKANEHKLMKLELGSSISFSEVYSPSHQSVKGGISSLGKKLMKNENLSVVLYEPQKTDTVVLAKVVIDNVDFNLKHTNINRTVHAIDFKVQPPTATTKNGYYCLDSVYLFGNIPLYSLFKGKSRWDDTTAWSHLPAERHRHALVKGEASIATDTHCDFVDLKGGLSIAKNKTFSLKELTIHETSSGIQNKGELLINGQLSISRTFPEKGAWYFISFPFDVYADGIDSGFTLKDDTPNEGGNFIYALTYDGASRNNEQTIRSNWNVLPAATSWGNSPVFEKNKGYLLAVDENASATTIRFTSRAGAIPPTFGRSGQLDIDIPYTVDENNSHGGWYLCGNPLPAPLHIRELNHPALDGYVYVFNGENYTPIPLEGNYTLPPYSAFFLKAKQSVSLAIGSTEDDGNSVTLSGMLPLRANISEPAVDTPINNTSTLNKENYQIERTTFSITNAPEKGSVTLFDSNGRQVFVTKFAAGESRQIALPERQGFYILLLQTQNRRKEYKFIR